MERKQIFLDRNAKQFSLVGCSAFTRWQQKQKHLSDAFASAAKFDKKVVGPTLKFSKLFGYYCVWLRVLLQPQLKTRSQTPSKKTLISETQRFSYSQLTEWVHTSLSSLCSVSHLPATTSSLPSTSASRPFAPAVSSAGMSRLQGPSSLKRKRPELNSPVQSLTEHERILYDVIRSKQDIGIWTRDMKKEAKLPDNVVNKSLKALQVKNLIKEVVNIQNKGRKHFMATEFEPSKEISGGAWYLEGSLDTEFIESLRQLCKRQIEKKGVATLEEVTDLINSYPAFNVDVTKQQIEEILRTLIWDNAIMEVKSNGMGEFASIPFGKVCYRYVSKGGLGGEPRAGALASIPCGVCPRISHCTPDGVISPKTCVYYQKWLDF